MCEWKENKDRGCFCSEKQYLAPRGCVSANVVGYVYSWLKGPPGIPHQRATDAPGYQPRPRPPSVKLGPPTRSRIGGPAVTRSEHCLLVRFDWTEPPTNKQLPFFNVCHRWLVLFYNINIHTRTRTRAPQTNARTRSHPALVVYDQPKNHVTNRRPTDLCSVQCSGTIKRTTTNKVHKNKCNSSKMNIR